RTGRRMCSRKKGGLPIRVSVFLGFVSIASEVCLSLLAGDFLSVGGRFLWFREICLPSHIGECGCFLLVGVFFLCWWAISLSVGGRFLSLFVGDFSLCWWAISLSVRGRFHSLLVGDMICFSDSLRLLLSL